MNYEEYQKMRSKMTDADQSTRQCLERTCQINPWLKHGGIAFEDDPIMEEDYTYQIWTTENISALEQYFRYGNWAIRNGVVFHDLAFINQVNGGDEWWTLKHDAVREAWVPFESITFQRIIERGEFFGLIRRMEEASMEQCLALNY